MIIESAMFYVHEEVSREQDYSSQTPNCTTVIIGICSYVDKIVANAVAAGAIGTNPCK